MNQLILSPPGEDQYLVLETGHLLRHGSSLSLLARVQVILNGEFARTNINKGIQPDRDCGKFP